VNSIPDHLRAGLKIVFIGYNPSIMSSETGHHYANPNNRFWNILFQAGLTPKKLSAFEDAALLEYGYGLTNIVERPTRAADEITKEEYIEGAQKLREKLTLYMPEAACYVGKGVYQAFSGQRQVTWGWQTGSAVQGVKDFVAPSSSGLVRMKLSDIINIYRELLEFPG